MFDLDELVGLDDPELIDGIYLNVDWREGEEAIIEGFAGMLPDEDLEPFWKDDETLGFRLNGDESPIPLTSSPVDRYVAISSLASVLGDKYEVRLLTVSLESDTHALLILPLAAWKTLDEAHGEWTRAHFQPLRLGKDYFGGGEIPYLGRT